MIETTPLYKLPAGSRFKFPGGDHVYITGRTDGACVNISDDAGVCGPVYAWIEVVLVPEADANNAELA